MRGKYTKQDVLLLGLIAYKYGEISIGKCREVTGLDDKEIREQTK